MVRNSRLWLLLGSFLIGVTFSAAVGDINVCTNICAGNNISCKNQYLNCGSTNADSGSGLGDLLNSASDASMRFYDWKELKEARSENLGQIKNSMTHTFNFPSMGQKKMITFVPTEGVLSGKKVKLLFVSFDLRAKSRMPKNTPKDLASAIDEFIAQNSKNEIRFQSMVRIFGHIEGGASLWYDTGAINLDIKPDMKNFEINVKVEKDGEVIINDMDILEQTGIDGAKARIAPIVINFSQIPEMTIR